MHIHQPRGHHQPGGVDHLVGLTVQAALQQAHPAVLRQNVLKQDGPRDWVDHPPIFNQKSHTLPPRVCGFNAFVQLCAQF